MTHLVIARHGNTFAPDEAPRRIGRRTDLPLVDKGRAQAAQLGRYLNQSGLIPDRVYCSTLQRTIQTAKGAIAAMELDSIPEPRAIFDEIDYGPDENRSQEQVRARLGEGALNAWEESDIIPEGWQPDARTIIQNWRAFTDEMRSQRPGSTILVVASGGIARFAPYMTGDIQGFRASYTAKLSPGTLGLIVYEHDQWRVKGWNIKP